MKFTSQGGDAWPSGLHELLGAIWVQACLDTPNSLVVLPPDGIVCNYGHWQHGYSVCALTLDAPPPTRWDTTSTCVTFGVTVDVGLLISSTTPRSDGPNYGCALGSSACGSTDMVQNYMDYSDDACMNLFTQGQSDRMNALFAPAAREPAW